MTVTAPLTTFTLFPELPTELRLKIWKYILPGPRNVEVYYSPINPKRPHPDHKEWASLEPVPKILHVCQESRAEGLQHYKLAFGGYRQTGRVYFNYVEDLLFMRNPKISWRPSEYQLPIFVSADHGAADCEQVQRLKIELGPDLWDRSEYCWDEIRCLPGLKTLIIATMDDSVQGVTIAERDCRDSFAAAVRKNPDWKPPQITLQAHYSSLRDPPDGILWKYPERQKAVKESVGASVAM